MPAITLGLTQYSRSAFNNACIAESHLFTSTRALIVSTHNDILYAMLSLYASSIADNPCILPPQAYASLPVFGRDQEGILGLIEFCYLDICVFLRCRNSRRQRYGAYHQMTSVNVYRRDIPKPLACNNNGVQHNKAQRLIAETRI